MTGWTSFAQRCALLAVPAAGVLGAISVSLVLAASAGGQAEPDATSNGRKADRGAPPIVRELPELRTSRSRTYETADGGPLARVFTDAVNVKDASGKWQPIQPRLADAGSRYESEAGRIGVELPKEIGQAPVRVTEGEHSLAFRLLGASGSASVKDATVSYPDVIGGVDVTYDVEPHSVKETLLLPDRQAPSRYTFALDASSGLELRLAEASRRVEAVDERGDVRLFLEAPFMVDAEGERSDDVRYGLERAGDGWRLELTASRAGSTIPVARTRWRSIRRRGRRLLISVRSPRPVRTRRPAALVRLR